VSVCQRSSQGAQAPQRSVRAARGRDSLPSHLELTRTSAKGSFSFTEGSCGNCIPEFGFGAGCSFRFEPVWESVDRNPASEWDALSFCGPWRKLRPRSRAQNGMHFPVEASNGKRIPVSCEKRGALFGRLLPAHVRISARYLGPARPDIPPTFAPLCRPFGRLSARAGILKTILFLCNTMQVRPARFEGGRDGEDSRR
jgi:hypothetical protein